MTIIIRNISTETAIIKRDGDEKIYLLPGKSANLESTNNIVSFSICPKMNTVYHFFDSRFVVLTEYSIESEREIITVNIDYQEAKVKLKANHIYQRFSIVGAFKEYKCVNSIIPEHKHNKRNVVLDFLVNVPLSIVFEGFGMLIISVIVSLLTDSFVFGIITFTLLLIIISIYEVVEEVILNKIFNKAKRKSKLLREADEPIFFQQCSESNFIEYCFKYN